MILDFKDIKKEDVSSAGGKGANLGEMISAGINVPDGFVITVDIYKEFIKENNIEKFIFERLEEAGEDENKLLAAAGDFRKKIQDGKFPLKTEDKIREKYLSLGENIRVAVRSSATAEDLPKASFAGQQESYLNVRGVEDVLDKIRSCYASLWGNRAVIYRLHQGYDQNSVAIAAVVQEMVESEKAGVLFTVNPVNKNKDEVQINASYGLGESIVSGRVTADSYIVNKSGKIVGINIGSKEIQIVYADKDTRQETVSSEKRSERALNDNEIKALLKAGLEIENHYCMPMDIEWAIKGEKIYILQARAITGLENDVQEKVIENYIKNTRLTGIMKKNMAFQFEKMPFAYRALDFDYMIAINDQKARIFAEIGIELNSNPGIDEDGIQTLPRNKKGINKNILHIFRTLRSFKNFEHCYKVCNEFMDKYKKEIEKIRSLSFENMSIQECEKFMAVSYELTKNLAYDRFKYALFPSMFMFNKFTKLIKKVNRSYSAFDFYWELNNKTAVISSDIADMAYKINKNGRLKEAVLSGADFEVLSADFPEFKSLADEFIKKNGFKSDYNCYCIEAKTFIEDPDRIINILRPILNADDSSDFNNKNKDFAALMKKIENICGNKYTAIEKDIHYFRYFHIVREESQYMWECLFYYVRKCIIRINRLLLNSTDYKHGVANLFHHELLNVLKEGCLDEFYKEKIIRRNEKFPLAIKVWEASKLLVFETGGDVLKGVGASAGSVAGKVCIICSPKEFYKMKKGDILVCHLTDPEWTPLFKLASAVVADTGAALSHAAIVAREFNIPAVLGVGFATEKFKDGDMIRVDGDKGEVRRC